MTAVCNRNAVWAALLAGAALTAAPSHAQTAPPPAEVPAQDQLTVTGQKLPQAEAPRSSTCEALARDPYLRASGRAGRAFMPTRPPRNPDYSAPPLVPAGSPLPSLSKSRFGVRDRGANDASATVGPSELVADADIGTAGTSLDQDSYASAVAACQGTYMRGGRSIAASGGSTGFIPASSALSEGRGPLGGAPMSNPEFRVAAGNARYVQARAFIASRDTTLPMAFALFDQGRYGESLEWFRKASNKLQYREGGDEAALFVGKLYLQGLGDKSDPAEGVKWLKKAATAPFDPTSETPRFDPRQPDRNTAVGEAAVILGNLYRTGFAGIARDGEEARRWFARANAVGHVPAAKALGDLYYNGTDLPRDVKKAVSYYRQAAKLDHPSAQFALAEILNGGEEGIAQDKKEALGWYQAAARNGHPGALYALARAYDLGDGVKADPARAIGFYKSAALAGNAAAMTAMGTYFYRGELVARDHAVARRWFETAAQTDTDGMFNLAAMLTNGEGGDKDLVKAWRLLKRASALGHPTAPRALAALEKRMTAREREAATTAQQTR